MSIKPENKILTYEQARELKFFMRNCTGTRQEFYALLDQTLKFKEKLDRLEHTSALIEKYFGKEIEEWERKISESCVVPGEEFSEMKERARKNNAAAFEATVRAETVDDKKSL